MYALLDPSATFSFVKPYVAMKFDILPEGLVELILASTRLVT